MMQIKSNVGTSTGTLSGYINDVKFGEHRLLFLPIPESTHYSSVGGMMDETRIYNPFKTWYLDHGLFFHGQIDNFVIRNPKPLEKIAALQYSFDDGDDRYKNFGYGGMEGSLQSWMANLNPRTIMALHFKALGPAFLAEGVSKFQIRVLSMDHQLAVRTGRSRSTSSGVEAIRIVTPKFSGSKEARAKESTFTLIPLEIDVAERSSSWQYGRIMEADLLS